MLSTRRVRRPPAWGDQVAFQDRQTPVRGFFASCRSERRRLRRTDDLPRRWADWFLILPRELVLVVGLRRVPGAPGTGFNDGTLAVRQAPVVRGWVTTSPA